MANGLDISETNVNKWLRDARSEGIEVRSPMRKPRGDIAVKEDKISETLPVEEEVSDQQPSDQLVADMAESVKMFSKSHLILGESIEKLFRLIGM